MLINEYTCTGSLINNANNDNTPYVLTAWHCIVGETNLGDHNNFIYSVERMQTNKISCPEEIAFRKGFINKSGVSLFVMLHLSLPLYSLAVQPDVEPF